MNFTEATDAVAKHVVAGWVSGGSPRTDIAIEGETPPYKPGDAAYITLAFRGGGVPSRTLGSTGNRKYTRSGVLIVQIFTPLSGGGQKPCNVLADHMKDLLESPVTGLVELVDCEINPVGAEKGYYQINASVRFVYEEVK